MLSVFICAILLFMLCFDVTRTKDEQSRNYNGQEEQNSSGTIF